MLASLPVVAMLGVDMFADEEIPTFFAYVTMPEGTRLEATDRTLREMERLANEVIPDSDRKNVLATTGVQETEGEWIVKPSVGQLLIELHDKDRRQTDIITNMNRLRERAELVPGVLSLEFKRISSGPPTGAPIEFKVRGEHLGELIAVSEEVKAALQDIDGVTDIRDDFLEGVPELRVFVDEERATMAGLTVTQVAMAVQNAFQGMVATQFLDGDDDIDVLVRLDERSRAQPEDLANLTIATPTGGRVPLKDLAEIREASGYSSIKRDDNRRAITVTAGVDENVISGVEASQRLMGAWPAISARHPGFDLKFGGEFAEFQEAFTNLGLLFLVGIAIMLTLMAAQFNSITQPLIIFMAVIFAFWGAAMGLAVIGSPFSINNLFGLVALAGVAVNNSIVLISFVNSLREQGYSRYRAVLKAGELRVRPILLTSFTTVVGLLPMAIGLGGYSAVWGPLATIMVWGLVSSSILTLFLIPALYIGMGDMKRLFFSRKLRDEHVSRLQWKERKRRRRLAAEVDQPSALAADAGGLGE
jgi:multidrug efflux pump subunit AcrB